MHNYLNILEIPLNTQFAQSQVPDYFKNKSSKTIDIQTGESSKQHGNSSNTGKSRNSLLKNRTFETAAKQNAQIASQYLTPHDNLGTVKLASSIEQKQYQHMFSKILKEPRAKFYSSLEDRSEQLGHELRRQMQMNKKEEALRKSKLVKVPKRRNDKILEYVNNIKKQQENDVHEVIDVAGVKVRLNHHDQKGMLEEKYQEELASMNQNIVSRNSRSASRGSEEKDILRSDGKMLLAKNGFINDPRSHLPLAQTRE